MLGSRSISRVAVVRFQAPVAAAARPRGALFCSATAGKATGTVKWFDVTKGYGFIQPEDGSTDLFVHQTAIVTDGFRSLRDGEPVEFVAETGDDGRLRAVQVTGPDGANPEGAPPKAQGSFNEYGGGGGGGRRGGGGGGGRSYGGGGARRGDSYGGGEDDYGSYRY